MKEKEYYTNGKTIIVLKRGDITEERVDVIVNAANKTLLGGRGVDGAIHRVAGEELLYECSKLGGCETGEAKITGGYELPARHVIHTVGPFYGNHDGQEDELLAKCYRNSLQLARENDLESIAFPCISTGAYLFPEERAAQIAIKTVLDYLERVPIFFEKIIFVAFNESSYNIYRKLLDNKFK